MAAEKQPDPRLSYSACVPLPATPPPTTATPDFCTEPLLVDSPLAGPWMLRSSWVLAYTQYVTPPPKKKKKSNSTHINCAGNACRHITLLVAQGCRGVARTLPISNKYVPLQPPPPPPSTTTTQKSQTPHILTVKETAVSTLPFCWPKGAEE